MKSAISVQSPIDGAVLLYENIVNPTGQKTIKAVTYRSKFPPTRQTSGVTGVRAASLGNLHKYRTKTTPYHGSSTCFERFAIIFVELYILVKFDEFSTGKSSINHGKVVACGGNLVEISSIDSTTWSHS